MLDRLKKELNQTDTTFREVACLWIKILPENNKTKIRFLFREMKTTFSNQILLPFLQKV